MHINVQSIKVLTAVLNSEDDRCLMQLGFKNNKNTVDNVRFDFQLKRYNMTHTRVSSAKSLCVVILKTSNLTDTVFIALFIS